MRDGKIVANDGAMAFDRDRLVAVMGGAKREAQSGADTPIMPASAVRVRAKPVPDNATAELVAREGEVIGPPALPVMARRTCCAGYLPLPASGVALSR